MVKHLVRSLLQRMELTMLDLRFIRDISRPAQMALVSHFRQMCRDHNACLNLEDIGFNIYSPNYEDGILLYIFSLIGTTNRKLVDIGAGSIKGSIVANLIVNHGFSGLLIDGSKKEVELSRSYYLRHPETRLFPPTSISEFVTAENVNRILEEHGLTGEIDLLSIDIDGIDYWVWKAIDVVRPRVVVVEYQDILGPENSWTIPYQPDFDVRAYPVNKQFNNYCGASLRALARLGRQKGYRLVGCNRGGWNAFFVREGIGEEHLREVPVASCFKYEWNRFGMEKRFPLVKDMTWQEV